VNVDREILGRIDHAQRSPWGHGSPCAHQTRRVPPPHCGPTFPHAPSAVSEFGRFGARPFRSSAVSELGRLGVRPFRSRCFGVRPFRHSAVSESGSFGPWQSRS
jgi:hypothetical protein